MLYVKSFMGISSVLSSPKCYIWSVAYNFPIFLNSIYLIYFQEKILLQTKIIYDNFQESLPAYYVFPTLLILIQQRKLNERIISWWYKQFLVINEGAERSSSPLWEDDMKYWSTLSKYFLDNHFMTIINCNNIQFWQIFESALWSSKYCLQPILIKFPTHTDSIHVHGSCK